MTGSDIDLYDVGNFPQDDPLWIYSKINKAWVHSIPYLDWLFVFCLFDEKTTLLSGGSHFRYHILNKRNKGIEFDNCPQYIKNEFEYQLKIIEEKGFIKKENKNE